MAELKQVTQNYLDSEQYLAASILQYESIFGIDFVSPGGREMAIEMINRLALAPDSRVLDVGCGLGGSSFVMAKEFGLSVDGIDLSKNMLAMANTKLAINGLSDRVTLKWQDCLDLSRVDYYDAVYSRDVFLHIVDKSRLFSVLQASLKRGGQLLFTDYCCGPKPWDDDFSDYVENRAYCLHTPTEYAGLIAKAGFEQVEHQDLTGRFTEILRSDLEKIATLDLATADRAKLEKNWNQKIARSISGDHRWGLFTAVKPG